MRSLLAKAILLFLVHTKSCAALDEGFEEEDVVRGSYMTEMVWTPDASRMFVSHKKGNVQVYENRNGDFENGKTALDIEDLVCTETERGLGGMALHPRFGSDNRWIYLFYTFKKRGNCNQNGRTGPSNRLARYEVKDDWTIDFDSETVFFDTPPCEENIHNSGSINFGNDGYLYVTTGDQGSRGNSRTIDSLLGGIVRLTDDNQIPPTNPFVGQVGAVRCNQDGTPNEDWEPAEGDKDSDPPIPMEIAGNNGEPSSAFPLQRCQGDCDNDGDCASDLVCFQRGSDSDRVPGCSVTDAATDRDICAKATPGGAGEKCLELYAIGLRNPFKMSMNPNVVDKVEFMINDVGAELWEEMSLGGDDFQTRDNTLGLPDYGWAKLEGPCRPNRESNCQEASHGGEYIPPYHFYMHKDGGAAVGSTWIPNGVWPPQYDGGYLYAEFVFGKIFLVQDVGVDHCYSCNPPESGKDVSTFVSYNRPVGLRFGPYKGCQKALYYTSIANGGRMRRVIYTGDDAPEPVCEEPVDNSPPTSTIERPTASPTSLVLVEEGPKYPGDLLPWSQDCSDGIDFCGILEFCSGSSTDTFAYRLPCEKEPCECVGMSGPLIRVEPGNLYHLVLRNVAEEEVVTNLHTHGLHIVGSGNGDDVVRQVAGGGNCLDYVWNITRDHPGGTYWYHAHHHGAVQRQIEGGAFGLLIVEDNLNLNPDMPAWASNERILQIMHSNVNYEVFGNRKTNEAIDIEAFQWYRLRVSIVDSEAEPYNLTFHDDSKPSLCTIHRVANDGIWRSKVPGPSSHVFEMTGASRADFAIRCLPSLSDDVELLVPITFGGLRAATVRIGPKADTNNRYEMQEWTPERPYALQDLRDQPISDENKFEIKLGYDYVNGKQWDPLTPLATIPFDSVHEWNLTQTSNHPFHIHLYHMQIVEPGGCGAHEEGEWYDVISAPNNSSCTVRFFTSDVGQRCVLHCHVLFHEDAGSMSWVNVTGPGMPMNDVESFQYQCASSFPLTESPGLTGVVPSPTSSSNSFSPVVSFTSLPTAIPSQYSSVASLAPSPSPSTSTKGQLAIVGDEGEPSSAFPLQLCQGDCDRDSDCSGSLSCFERSNNEEVPGCTGEAEKGEDYCIETPTPEPTRKPSPEPTQKPSPEPTLEPTNVVPTTNQQPTNGVPTSQLSLVGDDGEPSSAYPLLKCQGDCDRDSDCSGSLSCFERSNTEEVPGCTGEAEKGEDYCFDTADQVEVNL